jgi:hypothetical protein
LALPVKNDQLQRAWLSMWRRAHIVRACEVSLKGQVLALLRLIERAQIRFQASIAQRMQEPTA